MTGWSIQTSWPRTGGRQDSPWPRRPSPAFARIGGTDRAGGRFTRRKPPTMKNLVAYKRVVDANVRIQVRQDGSGVVTDGVKLSAIPFDEIALEEALRLRDKGVASEVVV